MSRGEDHPEWVGISGGLISLSVLAVAETFEKLYEACLEVAGLLARLCRFTSVKSRSMEDRSGAWGWTVLGIESDELRRALDQYQQSMVSKDNQKGLRKVTNRETPGYPAYQKSTGSSDGTSMEHNCRTTVYPAACCEGMPGNQIAP